MRNCQNSSTKLCLLNYNYRNIYDSCQIVKTFILTVFILADRRDKSFLTATKHQIVMFYDVNKDLTAIRSC